MALTKYIVTYHDKYDESFDEYFACHAEDEDHAREQCVNAYPDCAVLTVQTEAEFQKTERG